MPRLPELAGDRRPAPSPSSGVARYAPVDTSSVGRIVSAAGSDLKAGAAALGTGARDLAKAVAKEEDRIDQLAVEDAFNEARREQLRLTSGESDGFLNVRGQEAVKRKLYSDYSSQLDESMLRISKTLTNDRQRDRFLRRAEVVKLQFGGDVLAHVRRESDAAAKATHLATVEIERQVAVDSYADPGAVALSIERIRRSIDDYADREGWSPEVRKAAVQEEVSGAHVGVIDHMLVVAPARAKAYYNAHKKEISGSDRTRIEETLRVSDVQRRGQESSDAILAKVQPSSDDWAGEQRRALQAARSISDPKLRDEAVKRVSARLREMDYLREQETEQVRDQIWNLELRGGRVPPSMIEHLQRRDPAALRAFNAYQTSGAPDASNPTVLQNLNQSYRAAILGDPTFLQTDIRNHYHQLTVADREKWENRQSSLLSSVVGEEKSQQGKDVARSYSTAMSIVDRQLRAADIDPTPKEGSDDAKKLVRFQERIFAEVDAWHLANPGRKMPEGEIRSIAAGLLETVTIEDGGFLWFDAEAPAFMRDGDATEEIPAAARGALADAIRRAGEIPTAGRMLYYWRQREQ